MIRTAGWAGVFKNTRPEIVKTGNNNSGNASPINFAYVETVNYSTGKITCNLASSKMSLSATPLNPNIKAYPIAGEMVTLLQIPNPDAVTISGNGPLSNDNFIRYISGINIWNNPSLNAINDSDQLTTTSSPSYFSPTKIANILPLLSLPGDIIYEGRFGNSIRLGNTNSSYPNDWSSSGGKGDPIIIINNGQSDDLVLSRSTSTTENLTTNLSSIYLTSYQRLSSFYIANSSFSSYDKETTPKFPSEYNSPQIVLNSDRIVLNAKKDHIIISGEKSVGLSSNQSVNINGTKKVYIEGLDVRIGFGSQRATEPALLGNETVKLLIKLTTQIQKLAKIAETLNTYEGGKKTPDSGANTIGGSILGQCESILNTLNDNERGIKSNFVKIR